MSEEKQKKFHPSTWGIVGMLIFPIMYGALFALLPCFPEYGAINPLIVKIIYLPFLVFIGLFGLLGMDVNGCAGMRFIIPAMILTGVFLIVAGYFSGSLLCKFINRINQKKEQPDGDTGEQ